MLSCPSIRLAPKSAPATGKKASQYRTVSVDQVSSEVGSPQLGVDRMKAVVVSVDQVSSEVGSLCGTLD